MNLLENSGDAQKMRDNLFNLLDSSDESNIEVGTQILWNLEIPEDWILFLFEKKHKSPAISRLLLKHFPQKEFEAAHKWFSLSSEKEKAKHIDLFIQLPKLHQVFSWKNILPLNFPPIDYPYFAGGVAEDISTDIRSSLFNHKNIPNNEIIPFFIDEKNVLNLPPSVNSVPPEIVNFPKISSINHSYYLEEEKISYDLPFEITKMDNLISVTLNGLSEYEKFKINGISFIEVLNKQNPSLLSNLFIFIWFSDYPFKRNYLPSGESFTNELKDLGVDKRILKFIQVVKLSEQNLEETALTLLKELYEDEEFYDLKLGKDMRLVTSRLNGIRLFEYILDFFEKQNHKDDIGYGRINLELIIGYINTKNHLKGFYRSKKALNFIEYEYYSRAFTTLNIYFFLNLNKTHTLYSEFMDEFGKYFTKRVEECFEYCVKGFITKSEMINQVEDVFGIRKLQILNLINKFQDISEENKT